MLLCRVLISWLLLHAARIATRGPAAAVTSNSPPAAAVAPTPPQLVLFDHDGGVDDFITLLLLLSSAQKATVIGEPMTVHLGTCHPDPSTVF